MSTGSDCRRRREALGVPLATLAEATGIPEEYLAALEANDEQAIPPGYAPRYAAAVRKHLSRLESRGLEALEAVSDPSALTAPTGPIPTPDGDDGPATVDTEVRVKPVPDRSVRPATVPLPILQGVAVAAILLAVILLGVELSTWLTPTPAGPIAERPIEIKVLPTRNVRLQIDVDGRRTADRLFAGGEVKAFKGREVALHVPDIADVKVWLDDRPIRPMGRKGRPRVLRFFADDEVP